MLSILAPSLIIIYYLFFSTITADFIINKLLINKCGFTETGGSAWLHVNVMDLNQVSEQQKLSTKCRKKTLCG